MIYNSGLFDKICEVINPKDLQWIDQAVVETVANIYSYKNSILGILETIKTDYKDVEFDAVKIQ